MASFNALLLRSTSRSSRSSMLATALVSALAWSMTGDLAAQPCQVVCNAPNLIPENEPCGFNAPASCGCDCTPPGNFLFLRCPEGYCATTWADNNSQDTDWFNVIVNDPDNDGTERVCFTITPEFPAVIELYSGTCGGLTMLAQGETANCQAFTLCACVAAPAQYKLKVYPGTIAGGPMLSGLPCTSAQRDYTITYQCAGPCAGNGACCYQIPGVPGSLCTITSQSDCALVYGGTWLGPNTVCSPDPCHPATGACCHIGADGLPTCTVTTQADCVQVLHGVYQGDGSVCTPDPCSQGACCHQVPGTTIFQCIVTSQANCATLFNSTWLGPNTICPPPPVICHDPEGACCYQDATGPQCIITTAQNCATLPGGTWQGANTTCNPNPCFPPGACCYTTTAGTMACVITTQAQCHNVYNGIWQGANTTCNPNPCQPSGACCYPDPTGQGMLCSITTQSDCVQVLGGIWQGPNTTCNPNPCTPRGACCFQGPAGPTCVVTTAADCAQIYNGIYQGDNTPCTAVTCPPSGACCHTIPGTTITTCSITTQANCAAVNGTWFGPNTTCNPNPCIPTGACCFQDGVLGPVTCIVTTQQNCANYPNSVWHGPNTTCNPNPCPSGACCYQVPGTPGWNCIIATPQLCASLHGNYQGNGTSCANVDCDPCVRPPLKMVAWWTLDETIGGIASDSVFIHHGTYMPSTVLGPMPAPGMVGNGLAFDGVDDHLKAPHTPLVNFGCGPFTIDAWIFPNGFGGGIVNKQNPIGYDFLVTSTGQLGLYLTTSSTRCPVISTGSIPLNQWSHVAVTATGGGPTRTVTFYINGVNAGSSTTPCVCVGNNGSINIGRSPFAGYLRGRLDEIEMFRAVLPQSQINAIYQAGSAGKCKTRVHAPKLHPFCANQNQVTVPITICNDSNVPYNYNVSFQPLNTCQIPGPTVFTPLFSNPVSVPANNCVTVQVTINRPVGMVAALQVACYQVNALNLSTAQSFYGQGSLIDRRDLCAVIGPCCIGTGVIDTTVGLGNPATGSFQVTNTGQTPLVVPYMLKAFDSQSDEPSDELSLNGLPPGTRYIGELPIAPGGSADVPFTAGYELLNALAIDDIVLSTDVDGDGTYEPLMSIGVQSQPQLCRADISVNGAVDVDDLLAVINAWGPCQPPPAACPADIAPAPLGNGVVNVDDLLTVINSWGACP